MELSSTKKRKCFVSSFLKKAGSFVDASAVNILMLRKDAKVFS